VFKSGDFGSEVGEDVGEPSHEDAKGGDECELDESQGRGFVECVEDGLRRGVSERG
jgi:hypothetical protein